MKMQGHRAIGKMALAAGLSLVALSCCDLAQAGAADSAAPLQVACAPERPVLHPGESVALRAWIGDDTGHAAAPSPAPAPSLVWRTDKGQIAGGDAALWTLPADGVVPGSVFVYRAVAVVQQGPVTAECELQVYVVAPQPQSDNRGPIGARGLLVGQAAEPKNYGLVSYLLLRRPAATEPERQRHLSAVAAVLSGLSSIEDLLQIDGVKPGQLYIVLLPVKRRVELPDTLTPTTLAEAAQRVLDAYNYDRARVLLSDTAADGARSGPYLAIRTPSAAAAAQTVPPTWDMSHVDQSLVRDWVNAYCALAAQPRSWNDLALTKLSLNTRNAIAFAARNLPNVLNNLDRWMPSGSER